MSYNCKNLELVCELDDIVAWEHCEFKGEAGALYIRSCNTELLLVKRFENPNPD